MKPLNLDLPITVRDVLIFCGVTLLAYAVGEMIDDHYRQLQAVRAEQFRIALKLEALTCPECIVERNRAVAEHIASEADPKKSPKSHACGVIGGVGLAVCHG